MTLYTKSSNNMKKTWETYQAAAPYLKKIHLCGYFIVFRNPPICKSKSTIFMSEVVIGTVLVSKHKNFICVNCVLCIFLGVQTPGLIMITLRIDSNFAFNIKQIWANKLACIVWKSLKKCLSLFQRTLAKWHL